MSSFSSNWAGAQPSLGLILNKLEIQAWANEPEPRLNPPLFASHLSVYLFGIMAYLSIYLYIYLYVYWCQIHLIAFISDECGSDDVKV